MKYNRRLLTRRSLSARSLSEAGELKCSARPCVEYRSYIWLGSVVGRRDLYFFFFQVIDIYSWKRPKKPVIIFSDFILAYVLPTHTIYGVYACF